MKNLAENSGTVSILPDVLFHFRMRQSSITHTKNLSNLLDRWEANQAKYEALPEYQAQLLPACILSAGQMWIHYATFTEEERACARATIDQMQVFSKTHSHQVLRGEYSSYVKLACLITLQNHPILMHLAHHGNKVRKIFTNSQAKLYD